MKKKPTARHIVLLIAAVVLHLAVALQGFDTLARNGFLYDDSFYAFQIARNVAEGHGPTFDGIHLTNGFQPLYVFLLVPIYLLFGSSVTTPIYLALVLLALCTALTSVLLYLIVRRYASDASALAAATLWVLSPVVIRQAANGLETALALLLFATAVYTYLTRIRGKAPGPWAFVRFGALLGVCALARLDLVFLALAMLLDYLLLMRRQGGRGWFANVVRAAISGMIVYAPWLIYGWIAVGTPLQESGMATRFLSLAYAPFFDLSPRAMNVDGPDAAFVWGHLAHSASVLKANPVTHVLFRALGRSGLEVNAQEAAAAVSNVVGVLLALSFFVWAWRRERVGRRSELNFLLLYAAMMVAAYSTIVFGVFFFLRYYYPLFFVVALFAGLVFDDVRAALAPRPRFRRFVFAGAALYMMAFTWMAWTSAFRSQEVYRYYDVARWISENLDREERVGVFQSGAIGYLGHHQVINLDGKVNSEARRALRSGKLDQYLRDERIDIVIDDVKVLQLFLGPWDDADLRRLEARSVYQGADNGMPGWVGYRVDAVSSAGDPSGVGAAFSPGR